MKEAIFGMGVVLRLLLPILVAAHSLVILFYEQNAQAAHSVCCRFCLLQYAGYGIFHLFNSAFRVLTINYSSQTRYADTNQ